MTAPSITYGHGYLTDCDDVTDWTETTGGSIGGTVFACDHGDIFRLGGTCTDAADEYVYREYNLDNISSNVYSKYVLRWKTLNAADALGARVKLIFTSGSQWILGESAPQFETTWQVKTGTIDPDKTIDKIQLWADDYPDSEDGATSAVYYDFVLLHKGTFTFPFIDDISVDFENRIVDIVIPGRPGDITQYLGAPSPSIKVTGKIDIGASSDWGTPILEYLYRIWQEAHKDPWQWFSTGGLSDSDRIINCKVTLRRLSFVENKEATREWTLELTHFSLSGGDVEHGDGTLVWGDLQWLGI